jgi:hypothetical protein
VRFEESRTAVDNWLLDARAVSGSQPIPRQRDDLGVPGVIARMVLYPLVMGLFLGLRCILQVVLRRRLRSSGPVTFGSEQPITYRTTRIFAFLFWHMKPPSDGGEGQGRSMQPAFEDLCRLHEHR